MIVWLASYPRSGNTMFRMALYHLYGIKTRSVYSDADIVGMGADKIVGHCKEWLGIEQLHTRTETSFVKTHGNPPRSPRSRYDKAIHIVRDGRDALVSYAHYRVNVDGVNCTPSKSLDELLDADRAGKRWDGWSGHTRAWLNWPGKKVIVRYEDMLNDVTTVVANALNMLELEREFIPIQDGSIPKFEELGKKWPQFFRKGKSGSWRDSMSQSQLDKFWRQHSEMMKTLGYDYD